MNTATTTDTPFGTRRKMHRFERFLHRHTNSLTERFGADEAPVMRREMLDEYRTVIPQVPDIGGRRNRNTAALTLSSWALAVYRVVLRHGGSAQDAGEVVYRYARATVERVPRPLRPRLLGARRSRAEKMARWTHEHRYPAGWIYEFVDGAGQPFDFGVDITECGIVKFLHAQGADDLTPYLCHGDYVMWEAAGQQLTRTKTLAWGCDRCDFRTTCSGTTIATWPPEFVERNCGQPAA
jgi:hypothetical protein